MGFLPQINGIENKIDDPHYEYIDANEMIITNTNAMYPDAHGRLFVKTLVPEKVNMVAEYPNLTGADAGYTEDWGDFYVGTWEIQIIPQTQQLKDNFLHVLQTADANKVTEMVPTYLISSTSKNMVGAFINASQGQSNKVVMFASNETYINNTQFTVNATGLVKFLIADITPNKTYIITDKNLKTLNETEIQINSSPQGTLYFNFTLSSEHLITIGNATEIDYPPTVTLDSPEDGHISQENITFQCSAFDAQQLVNLSLYWNVTGIMQLEETRTETGTSATETFIKTNIPFGTYKWNCLAYDNSSQAGWGIERQFVIGKKIEIPLTKNWNLISLSMI